MRAYFLTFLSVFVINISYTYYVQAVQKNKELAASSWSALINLIASVVAIGYVENHWLVIPSCIGSFFGTWLGINISRDRH